MIDPVTLGQAVGFAVGYAVVGALLLGLGYKILDWITPGNLGTQIIEERSLNAALVTAANLLGLGLVLFVAIWTNSASGFGTNLEWTVVFGLVGMALQALGFFLLDWLTPGNLRALVMEKQFHPAALIAATSQIAIAGIVIASIA